MNVWVVWKRFQQLGAVKERSRTVKLCKKLNCLRDIEASKQVDTEYVGQAFPTNGFR